MTIDHIGLVVPSLQDGIQHWQDLFGYVQASEVVTNTRQKVNVAFLCKSTSLPVKLVEPCDDSTPVSKFARKGGGLHHVCWRCDDLETEILRLREKGARLITPPEPAEAFENQQIAFLLVERNLIVELIDTTRKARWKAVTL
jgi:methylmalonyl-CoA/ethylmalonyl-CoA epimerase